MAETHTQPQEQPQEASPQQGGASAPTRGEKNGEQNSNKHSADSSAETSGTETRPETRTESREATDGQASQANEKFERLAATAGLDAEAVARLRALGLDDAQLEAVLAIAEEHLLPLACALAEAHECENERAKLVRTLGSEQAWQALAPELLRWGRKNLSPEVFAVLAATAEGIQAMQKMRQAEAEPSMISSEDTGANDTISDISDLRRLMADPAYWSKRDPAVLARVREGFRRLYPS